ncbi:hypothetical protein CRUP_034846, partial [Coryphaenoides rupestris]
GADRGPVTALLLQQPRSSQTVAGWSGQTFAGWSSQTVAGRSGQTVPGWGRDTRFRIRKQPPTYKGKSSWEIFRTQLEIHGPDTPTVHQQPSPAKEDDHVTLSCSSDSLPPATFAWVFKGAPYIIAPLDEKHLGNYTCTASNAITGVKMSTVHPLNGVCVGQSILPAGPLSGAVGGAVNFGTTLEPPARPFIAVAWSFKGNSVISHTATGDIVEEPYINRVTLDQTTGSLELRGLALVDSGAYLLSVILDGGQQRTGTIELNVYALITGASITRSSSPATLIAGKSAVNLTCDAASGAVSSRDWMKNGRPLPPAPGRVTFSADARLLSINPVLSDNHGNYQCRVSNPVSAMTATYNLTVNCEYRPPLCCPLSEHTGLGPQNVSIVGPGEARLGLRVLLRCSVDSVPLPTFSWALNGNRTGVTNSTYIIERMEERHAGNYTCTVYNQVTRLENSTLMNLRGVTQ